MTATRRDFLKTSGALVVGLTVAGDIVLDAQGTAAGPYPDLDYKQLDSWIVIRPDNTATFFVGKTDLGQGPAPRSARSWPTSSTCRTTRRAA
jgi:hypothetical protein